MCGTNAGDLAAGPLRLGHVHGMLPISLLFLAVIFTEKFVSWTTVAFYWLAIILLRTMATNIADFATHDLRMSYPAFLGLLIAFMAVMIWADRFRGTPPPAGDNTGTGFKIPVADWSYWVLMLTAGVLGTALGDWLADDIVPGTYWASLVGAPIFAVTVWAAYRYGLTKPWYWLAIAACRTWGTDLGDMLVVMFRSLVSRPLALSISTALTALLLIVVIVVWTRRNRVTQSEPMIQPN